MTEEQREVAIYSKYFDIRLERALNKERISPDRGKIYAENFFSVVSSKGKPRHIEYVGGPAEAIEAYKHYYEKLHGHPPSSDEVRAQQHNFNYGFADTPFAALLDYNNEKGIPCRPDIAACLDLLPEVGWSLMYEDDRPGHEREAYVAILLDKPAEVRSENNQLHNPEGPAVTFNDGSKLYFYKGVSVPPAFIEDRERITAEHVLKEPNQEFRRILLAQMGLDRFIAEAGAELLDKSIWGKLWRITLDSLRGRATNILVVEVLNSTPEPDGTIKTYMIPVPPVDREGKAIQTARAAIAATFRLLEEEYDPWCQT